MVHMVAPPSPLLYTHVHSFTHMQLNASHTHTLAHARLGTTNDIRTKFAIIHNARQSKAVRDRRSSSSRDTSQIHSHTHTHTLALHTHARLERQQVQVHYTTICASGLKVYEAL